MQYSAEDDAAFMDLTQLHDPITNANINVLDHILDCPPTIAQMLANAQFQAFPEQTGADCYRQTNPYTPPPITIQGTGHSFVSICCYTNG